MRRMVVISSTLSHLNFRLPDGVGMAAGRGLQPRPASKIIKRFGRGEKTRLAK